MSARHMQRLGKALQGKQAISDELHDEDVQIEEQGSRPSVFSRLAALAGDDQDSDDSAEETQNGSSTAATTVDSQVKSSSKSKKKKKKKNAKAKAVQAEETMLDDLVKEAKVEENERILEEEQLDPKSVLEFDSNCLDADREVKRKLGKGLSSAAPAKAKPKIPRGARLLLPAGVTTSDRTHIPRVLVTPDSDWLVPQTFVSGEGARMVRVEGDVFSFEASDSYRVAQLHLREVSRTLQPQLIMDFSQTHPFHVDALLQLVDVFSSSSQNESAQMLLRTALYTLESWCSPAFRAGLGNGRFQIKLAEDEVEDEQELLTRDGGMDCGLNGAFLRSLALSMRVAGRRDCFETAFNLAKMCLSLSPKRDPCFVLLAIDYYALMAKQMQFILRAHSEEDSDALPSVIFAQALALLHESRLPQSTVPRESADALLRRACGRFPKYAEAILAKAGRDLPESLWVRLGKGVRDVEDRLCSLSVTRQASLWTPEAVSWMHDTLRRCEDALVFAQELPATVHEKMMRYARCSALDLSDKVELIPREEVLAEEDARMRFAQPQADGAGPRAQPPSNVNMNMNDLLLFLQTMMPWARLPDATPQAGGEDDAFDEQDWDDDAEDVN